MLRFHERADYSGASSSRFSSCSGKAAYRRYHEVVEPVFREYGASLSWIGNPMLALVAGKDRDWDFLFIGHYPKASILLQLLADPIYQEAEIHRTAALADYRLVACSPMPLGRGFGNIS